LNKILNKYSNSVALDGNPEPEPEPEPDLVHTTGCKQPSLKKKRFINFFCSVKSEIGHFCGLVVRVANHNLLICSDIFSDTFPHPGCIICSRREIGKKYVLQSFKC
jgi:hypothetical protein